MGEWLCGGKLGASLMFRRLSTRRHVLEDDGRHPSSKQTRKRFLARVLTSCPQYLAPEVVLQTEAKPGYEMVVDSWSIGVITYCMMTNVSPWTLVENFPAADLSRRPCRSTKTRHNLFTCASAVGRSSHGRLRPCGRSV